MPPPAATRNRRTDTSRRPISCVEASLGADRRTHALVVTAVHQVVLRPTGDQGRVAEERDVGADVLDQVVMSDDLLCQPVELAGCVHSCGTHVVEGLDRWDEAQAVGQRAGLV